MPPEGRPADEGRQALERVARELTRRGATLAVAESCSGGLLAAELTARSGASRYFLGGVVAYADEVKVRSLGVDRDVLARVGAVSEETARAMAQGVRAAYDATFAASITGIAGPGGGTPEKPVGLVFLAVADGSGVRTRREVFLGERDEVRWASVQGAAELLLEALAARRD